MSVMIEKNIPIPPLRPPHGGSGRKSMFEGMEIGDSMFLAGKTVMQAGSAMRARAKVSGHKFSARTVEGGVRIWRIA